MFPVSVRSGSYQNEQRGGVSELLASIITYCERQRRRIKTLLLFLMIYSFKKNVK